MKKTRTQWLRTIIEIGIAYVSIYFIVFLIGAFSFTFVTDLPVDRAKNASGLFLGILVNVVPFLLISWRTYYFESGKIHTVAVVTLITSFILEKALPLSLAYILSPTEPFMLLSEEFPYYSFGINYIIYGTFLSYLSFYIGLFSIRIVKHK